MGSVVEYRCGACTFSSGELRIGWGKSGRAAFWGGLARCEPCGEIGVANIAMRRARDAIDPRCATCGGLVHLLEGTSVRVPCPRCHRALDFKTVATWS